VKSHPSAGADSLVCRSATPIGGVPALPLLPAALDASVRRDMARAAAVAADALPLLGPWAALHAVRYLTPFAGAASVRRWWWRWRLTAGAVAGTLRPAALRRAVWPFVVASSPPLLHAVYSASPGLPSLALSACVQWCVPRSRPSSPATTTPSCAHS
jgi:hypothetical protein